MHTYVHTIYTALASISELGLAAVVTPICLATRESDFNS